MISHGNCAYPSPLNANTQHKNTQHLTQNILHYEKRNLEIHSTDHPRHPHGDWHHAWSDLVHELNAH